MLRIVIAAFNKPDILSTQINAIGWWCKYDKKIIVLNNKNQKSIEDVCLKLGVECRNPPHFSNIPSESHGRVLDWYCASITEDCDHLFLDHDIFPTKYFSFAETIGDNLAFGINLSSEKYQYVWPGWFGIKGKKMRGLMFSPTKGKDTGACWNWTEEEQNKIRFFHSDKISVGEGNDQQKYIETIDGNWVHFLGWSEWNGMSDWKRHYCKKLLGHLNNMDVEVIGKLLYQKNGKQI